MTKGAVALFMIPAMLCAMAMGMPFFAAMGGIGVMFGLGFFGWKVLGIADLKVWSFLIEPAFVAIPMFILMGTVLASTGIAESLFLSIFKLFGPVKGGLLVAVGTVCTLMAATTGVASGPVATMGLTALPVMLKQKYEPGLACGCISACGTLGTLIPPSTLLIIYGLTTEISIGQLYFAAFIPGFFLSFLFMVYFIVKTNFFSPYDAPPAPPEDREPNIGKALAMALRDVLPILFIIFAVLGTIYAGICTPTEGAGVGASGAVILSIIYRKFSWRAFRDALRLCYRATGMTGGVLIGANFFASVFQAAGGGQQIIKMATQYELSVGGLIAVCLFLNFIMGFVMNNMGIVLILCPVFVPALRKFGVDDLWFAMLFIFFGQVAYLTPPYAPGVYLLKPLCPPEIELVQMYKGIVPFVIIDILGAIIIYYFPLIATWLPAKMIE
ncbi:MAG: TRAP transporter large permease subunit [Chloroflexota bacterium]